MVSDPILVVATLARVFDTLAIRYLVGGSVASSMYGIPRATQDVDFVADIGRDRRGRTRGRARRSILRGR